MQYRPELLRESDRYRGRRRVPTPPRSRYAAVVTTAFLGAGVVAFGTGAALHDTKVDSVGDDFSVLSQASEARDAAVDRASRGDRAMSTSINQAKPESWLLPVHKYRVSADLDMRWNQPNRGVDLAVPEGTPFASMHDGVVVKAEWCGGFGLCVMIDHGDDITTVYGHASKIYVKLGQKVNAGDTIGLTGNTGYSYRPHLHLEVHINDKATDAVSWFKSHGVDIKLEIEDVYGGVIN